jgi:hypothetical protein
MNYEASQFVFGYGRFQYMVAHTFVDILLSLAADGPENQIKRDLR